MLNRYTVCVICQYSLIVRKSIACSHRDIEIDTRIEVHIIILFYWVEI